MGGAAWSVSGWIGFGISSYDKSSLNSYSRINIIRLVTVVQDRSNDLSVTAVPVTVSLPESEMSTS